MSDDGWGTPEVDYEMDAEGVTKDDLGGGGDLVNKEGWYHFEITDVVPDLATTNKKGKEVSPSVCFHMQVLQSVDGQSPAGSKLFHRVYVAGPGGSPISDGSRNNALRFGVGLGIFDERQDADGQPVIIEKSSGKSRWGTKIWQQAKGMQIIAKVALEKGDAKFSDAYKIPFGRVYQVDDPYVADTPKNKDAMAMIGKTAPAANGSGQKPPTDKPPAAPAPADDDLSDL